ncbi:U4/U6 small nuclear ribonucleoprotein prp4 [Lecanora helva]
MKSPSASPPSEGEIIESDDEKATTATALKNGINVDRPLRPSDSTSSSRSPSPIRSPRRSRSRTASRSPYREHRRAKRAPDDDHYDRTRNDPRRFKIHYEDRPSREKSNTHLHSHADRFGSSTTDSRSKDRSREEWRRRKQTRRRSRSPTHKASHRSVKDFDARGLYGDRPPRDVWSKHSGREYGESRHKLSTKQSVSDRGHTPVATAQSRHEAEFPNNQTHHTSNFSKEHNSLAKDDHEVEGTPSMEGSGQPTIVRPVDEAALIEQRRKKREAIKARYRGQETPILVESLALENKSEPSAPKAKAPASTNSTQPPASPQKSPPATIDAPGQDSPTDFVVLEDADLANSATATNGSMREDEPSAADYDPTMDMQEDQMRHDHHHRKDELASGEYNETTTIDQDVLLQGATGDKPPEKKTEDGFDMFADTDELDMFAEAPLVAQKPKEEVSRAVSVPQAKALDMSMLDDWDDPEGYYKVILGELLDNRYHVQSNLGKGMFSGVIRAMDQKTKSLVAIKLIRNNETMKKAGLKEINILHKLSLADPEDKKHLIRLERQFEHKGHLCMVFENLSINLREVLKKFGRDVGINIKAVRAYAQQLFLGLGLLRKCNLLHADLKPDNILVNESRNLLKICDLGSASDATENEITQYLVSRFYRAPEIILGMPYDFAIDVWSIGCTLFELYTGKILFTGRSNNQMLRAIMECRGKFSHKTLRKAQFASFHFDDLLNFRSVEKDKLTGKDTVRILNFNKPARDIKTRLLANVKGTNDVEMKELLLFVDLLERCLNLNPEKRCTPAEALRHPFIMRARV